VSPYAGGMDFRSSGPVASPLASRRDARCGRRTRRIASGGSGPLPPSLAAIRLDAAVRGLTTAADAPGRWSVGRCRTDPGPQTGRMSDRTRPGRDRPGRPRGTRRAGRVFGDLDHGFHGSHGTRKPARPAAGRATSRSGSVGPETGTATGPDERSDCAGRTGSKSDQHGCGPSDRTDPLRPAPGRTARGLGGLATRGRTLPDPAVSGSETAPRILPRPPSRHRD
jgi:hypothetical protein